MTDESDVDVVALYLLPEVNLRLQADPPEGRSSRARGSCRTTSTWATGSRTRRATVTDDGGTEHTIYLWTIKEREVSDRRDSRASPRTRPWAFFVPSLSLTASPSTREATMPTTYDAIIIGAGHNGLVTAAYLAKAGYKVLVLERRDILGGCCVTEEVWPGFKVSTAAYVNSLLRPEIIRDLELKKYGFEMLPRSPSSFTPVPGRPLPDDGAGQGDDAHARSPSSRTKDAEAYPKYEEMLTRVADFLEPMLTQTPPDPFGGRRRPVEARPARPEVPQARPARRRPRRSRSSPAPPRPILDRWFESERAEGDDRDRRRHRRVRPAVASRARRTCCSTTSWASATASAACGATSAAAWG